MKGLLPCWAKRPRSHVELGKDLPPDCVVTFQPRQATGSGAFKPILLLLLLCGIDIRGAHGQPLVVALALLFHAACLGIIALKTACLVGAFRWNVLVTMTMKLTALLLWWVVKARKERLRRLIDALSGELGTAAADSGLLMKTASVLVVAFMLVQPGLLSVRFFDAATRGDHPTCVLLSVDSGPQVVGVLLHEFASVYVNCSITYAVALLYVACCRAFSLGIEHTRLSPLKMFEKVLEWFP